MENYAYYISLHNGYQDITFKYNDKKTTWDAWDYFRSAIARTNAYAELWSGKTGEVLAYYGYEDMEDEEEE